MLKGAGNFLIHSTTAGAKAAEDTANGLRNGIVNTAAETINTLNPVGVAVGLEVPTLQTENAKQAAVETAAKIGIGIGSGVAAGAVAPSSAGSVVPTGTSQGAFVGPRTLPYDPRVRIRAIQDPKSHNFPYSFDNNILSTNPIAKPNGYRIFQHPGTMNRHKGVFEIGVNKDFVIDHRFFRPTK